MCLAVDRSIFLGLWECTSACWSIQLILSLFNYECLQILLKFSSGEWYMHNLPLNSSLNFREHLFMRDRLTNDIYLPFFDWKPWNLQLLGDLSIFHFMTGIVNYQSTNFLRDFFSLWLWLLNFYPVSFSILECINSIVCYLYSVIRI